MHMSLCNDAIEKNIQKVLQSVFCYISHHNEKTKEGNSLLTKTRNFKGLNTV